MKRVIGFILLLSCLVQVSLATSNQVLNVYAWAAEIPPQVFRQFEKQTGIHVNVTTFGANEVMFTKLKAAGNPGYDLVMASSYFVPRMRLAGLLQPIQTHRISTYANIATKFLHAPYDPKNKYCVPFLWGLTGIFYNDRYVKQVPRAWEDLFAKRFRDQLLLLNDPREVFSLALKSLGFSANDSKLDDLKKAFSRLKQLTPNIKLFNSDAAIPIASDGDASLGMIWNGDFYKAHTNNQHLHFVFPREGYVVWVDTFTLPKGAPHPDNAYKFLSFLLQPKIAAQSTLIENYATTVLAAKAYLPKRLQDSRAIYPPKKLFAKGELQSSLTPKARQAISRYWELLKLTS